MSAIDDARRKIGSALSPTLQEALHQARIDALEEAAKEADESRVIGRSTIAAAIRKLKETGRDG